MKNEEAFTLVEVLFAILMLSILIVGTIPVFQSLSKRNTAMEVRAGGMGAAQQVLDRLRQQDPPLMPTTGSDPVEDLTINNRTYQLTTSYCADTSLCTSINNRHLHISVDYRGEQIFEIETVYTRLR